MGIQVLLPQDFNQRLPIANGPERLEEALQVALKLQTAESLCCPIQIMPPSFAILPIGWQAR